MRVLITGGAGFVGASLAERFRREDSAAEVVVFDNLMRRGSELNLSKFRRAGIRFVHGDVRIPEDLRAVPGEFDVFIEASAEPSVLAGADGDAHYVLQTNLGGTLNCLEFARRRAERFIFLSTSRVYSIDPLREIRLRETASRFAIAAGQRLPGVSARGITEEFPVHLPRSFYGATKLASEMMIQEYSRFYGLRATIDRCGVIAGPGQFGKPDQGVFTYWIAGHRFGKALRYTGFGGHGKQVRDLLHPEDLFRLIRRQLAARRLSGEIFNVGGGAGGSTSLRELTILCREATGRRVPISQVGRTNAFDVPVYISDCRKAARVFGWKPKIPVARIVQDTVRWLGENEAQMRELFA